MSITSPAPTTPSTTVTRGEKITAIVETALETIVGQGKVHHVGADRFFVQLKHGRTSINRYFMLEDEEKTWTRGWEPNWSPGK